MTMRISDRFRRAASREAQRGMTLIEIMIVIIIMAMIATGVSLAVMKQLDKARLNQAKMDACAIRSGVQLYMAQNANQCPSSVDELKEDGQLDAAGNTKDPWGNDYVIDCEGNEPDVYSQGENGDGSQPIRCSSEEEK